MEAQHPGLLRFTSGFGQTTTLMMAGELDRAQELAQQLTDFAQMQQPGRAIGEVLVADVLIARGDVRGRGEVVARGGRWRWRRPVIRGGRWRGCCWRRRWASRTRRVRPSKVLSRAESRHGLKSMLFGPELLLARAWTTAARRDPIGARSAARDAARAAERGGQSAVALRAFHDAVRLGDIRSVDGDRPADRRRRLRVRQSGIAARPRARGRRHGCVEGGVGRVRRHRDDGLGRRRRHAGGTPPADRLPRNGIPAQSLRVTACWNSV